MRRHVVWATAVSVVLVGVMFVAGFPLRTYLQQRSSLLTASHQLQALSTQNRSLNDQIKKLNTDGEVERLARQYYGMVKPGEQAYVVLPSPSPGQPARAVAGRRGAGGSPPPNRGLWSRVTGEFSF